MGISSRDFGPVVRLDAESQGAPGQRTFRLIIANENEQASLWIEKEQLQALGTAIEQLMAQIEPPAGRGPIPAGPASTYETREFHINRLGLGFDETLDLFVVVAFAGDGEDEDQPDFQCRASREQMIALQKSIREIVAAGRPRCPLCNAPMGPEGHVCVKTNGHFKAAT